MIAPLCLCALSLLALDAGPARRIDLGDGLTLLVPPGFSASGGRVNLVVHLHGAVDTVERALLESGWDAAVLVFNRPGLSSVYERPFSDAGLLPSLIEKSLAALARESNLAEEPRLNRLVLSTFSAGFGGARALLAQPENSARIDALILADSLYCGYDESDPASRGPDPARMAGFRRFASEAAAGRKSMLVSHSAQVPEGYASTTETASDLIAAVGARPEPADEDLDDGWRLTRRASLGRFLVLGFDGAGPEDHLCHLRRLGILWKAAPDPFVGPEKP